MKMAKPNLHDGSSKMDMHAMGPIIAIVFPIAIAIWLGVYFLWPNIAGMSDLAARLAYALKWCCIASLLCLLTGVEAVAHERFQTDAFDPLAGHETRRLKINERYLQNTLEQTALFVPGLLALAVYCPDGQSMRAVVATAITWIISRGAFWIGYNQGSQYRIIGIPGMGLNMLVLLYVCGRFGYETAGWGGAAVPLGLFGLIELVLVRATRQKPTQGARG